MRSNQHPPVAGLCAGLLAATLALSSCGGGGGGDTYVDALEGKSVVTVSNRTGRSFVRVEVRIQQGAHLHAGSFGCAAGADCDLPPLERTDANVKFAFYDAGGLAGAYELQGLAGPRVGISPTITMLGTQLFDLLRFEYGAEPDALATKLARFFANVDTGGQPANLFEQLGAYYVHARTDVLPPGGAGNALPQEQVFLATLVARLDAGEALAPSAYPASADPRQGIPTKAIEHCDWSSQAAFKTIGGGLSAIPFVGPMLAAITDSLSGYGCTSLADISAGIAGIKSGLDSGFADMQRGIDALSSGIAAVSTKVDEINAMLDSMDVKIDSIGKMLNDAQLQQALEKINAHSDALDVEVANYRGLLDGPTAATRFASLDAYVRGSGGLTARNLESNMKLRQLLDVGNVTAQEQHLDGITDSATLQQLATALSNRCKTRSFETDDVVAARGKCLMIVSNVLTLASAAHKRAGAMLLDKRVVLGKAYRDAGTRTATIDMLKGYVGYIDRIEDVAASGSRYLEREYAASQKVVDTLRLNSEADTVVPAPLADFPTPALLASMASAAELNCVLPRTTPPRPAVIKWFRKSTAGGPGYIVTECWDNSKNPVRSTYHYEKYRQAVDAPAVHRILGVLVDHARLTPGISGKSYSQTQPFGPITQGGSLAYSRQVRAPDSVFAINNEYLRLFDPSPTAPPLTIGRMDIDGSVGNGAGFDTIMRRARSGTVASNLLEVVDTSVRRTHIYTVLARYSDFRSSPSRDFLFLVTVESDGSDPYLATRLFCLTGNCTTSYAQKGLTFQDLDRPVPATFVLELDARGQEAFFTINGSEVVQ